MGLEKLEELKKRALEGRTYTLPDGVTLVLRPVRYGELLLKSGGGEEVTLRTWLERTLAAARGEKLDPRELLEDPETSIRLSVLQERVADAYIALGVVGAIVDGERVPFEVRLDEEVADPSELPEHVFTVGQLKTLYGADEIAALRNAIMRLSGVVVPTDKSFRKKAAAKA